MSVIIRTKLIALDCSRESITNKELELWEPDIENLTLGYDSLIPCNPGQEDWSFTGVSDNLCLIPASVSPNLLDVLY